MNETKRTWLLIALLCGAVLCAASGCSSGPDKQLVIDTAREYANQQVKEARLRVAILGHLKSGKPDEAKALLEKRMEGDVMIFDEMMRKFVSVWQEYPGVLAEVKKAKEESRKALGK